MSKRLFFVTVLIGFPLVAGGCARDRHIVLTVTAEASAYEQAPFSAYAAGGHARVAYRLETKPHSLDAR
jgi:hypothetical protein